MVYDTVMEAQMIIYVFLAAVINPLQVCDTTEYDIEIDAIILICDLARAGQVDIYVGNTKYENVEKNNGNMVAVSFFGRKLESDESRLECFIKKPGLDYKGKINVTVSGRSCLAWREARDGRYSDDDWFPDENIITSGSNFCRHPVKKDGTQNTKAERPWCYTTDPKVTWEECGIPLCQELCKQSADGADYAGYISRTEHDHDCILWPDQTNMKINPKMKFTFPQDFPDWQIKILSQHKFCRNPASSQSAPWCYIQTDGTFELCIVPTCTISNDVYLSFNLSHEEFIKKLREITFHSGIILLSGQTNWQYFSRQTMNSQICSKVSDFSLVVIEKPNKYFFLGINCSKVSANRSTIESNTFSRAMNSGNSTEEFNYTGSITTQDYNPTEISNVLNFDEQPPETTSEVQLFTRHTKKVSRNDFQFVESYNSTTDIYSYTKTYEYDRNETSTSVVKKDVSENTVMTNNTSTIESNSSASMACLHCSCRCLSLNNTTKYKGLNMRKYKQDIYDQLKLNPIKLSKHFRSKMSVKDDRLTSIGFGIGAIVYIIAAFLTFVISDVTNICHKLLSKS